MCTENVLIFLSKAATEHGQTQTFRLVVNSVVKKAHHTSAQTILSDPFSFESLAILIFRMFKLSLILVNKICDFLYVISNMAPFSHLLYGECEECQAVLNITSYRICCKTVSK